VSLMPGGVLRMVAIARGLINMMPVPQPATSLKYGAMAAT